MVSYLPDEAKELGLITHLASKTAEQSEQATDSQSATMQLANELCAEIINRSPDAVLASKRVINRMYKQSACTLYQEKVWQTKLLLGRNRKLAVKKAKDTTVQFLTRQFR